MKVSSIQNLNSYNNSISKNPASTSLRRQKYALKNNSLIKQNASDTISFTGLLPFHKTTPVIQKAVSGLPVSKTLQKQAANLVGNIETFVEKGKVWITKNMLPVSTEDEKNALKKALSLMDFNKLCYTTAEDSAKEANNLIVLINKIIPKEKLDKVKPVLDKMSALFDSATNNSSDIEALYKLDDLLASVDKFCETESGTEIAFIRASGKLLQAISDIAKKQIQNQNMDALPIEDKANILKLCTRFLKDTKDIIAQSPEREDISEILKEISSIKLPDKK